jgi:hypothetical protein
MGSMVDDRERVLAMFMPDGTLTTIPRRRRARLLVLDELAQGFEPGRRYAEHEVNEVLARRHPDVAALRRYPVDEELLDRDAGAYWRAGGTFEP